MSLKVAAFSPSIARNIWQQNKVVSLAMATIENKWEITFSSNKGINKSLQLILLG
jgi:hypothetical protein